MTTQAPKNDNETEISAMALRIKSRREELDFTQQEVAKHCKIKRESVCGWEYGSIPRAKPLMLLAELFGVSAEWLLTGHGVIEKAAPINVTPSNNINKNDELDDTNKPIVHRVKLYKDSLSEHSYFSLPSFTLNKRKIHPQVVMCFELSGNSMSQAIPDGAIVAVDPTNKSIKDGDLYVIDHDGMIRVKILYRLPGGGIRLHSYNTAEHPDERYDPSESGKINIIGRVFWSCAYR
jgi:phage repressor protein C with HTH and peptisase S24 domain